FKAGGIVDGEYILQCLFQNTEDGVFNVPGGHIQVEGVVIVDDHIRESGFTAFFYKSHPKIIVVFKTKLADKAGNGGGGNICLFGQVVQLDAGDQLSIAQQKGNQGSFGAGELKLPDFFQ